MQHSRPEEIPLFNTARGAADATLELVPPFSFPGVTARVFPLRASMDLLSSFCDGYLNLAPEVCEVHPYLPFVFLVVLNYGRMAIEKANLGWVSQHEIFFAVPLGKWRRERGRSVFQGWVLNCPFIFVDNPSSLIGGRESYGWPKVLACLRPNLDRSLIDPRRATRLLSLDIEGFGSEDGENIRLLDIDQRVGQNPSLFPPDLSEIDPFERMSRLTRDTLSAGWDMVQLFLRAPLSGFGPRAPGARAQVLFNSLRQLSGFYRQPGVDVVTLKQFRDAHSPDQICYQALVQSRLSVARYNRGGLLGLYNTLQGDLTGGYRIRLHNSSSFPIAEALGLEVARERTVDGHSVSILEPFSPFWLNVDLTYGIGRSLCWRHRGSSWHRQGARIPSAHRPSPVDTSYNTVAGAAQQVWGGPFFMPQAHCNVFPLPADGTTLSEFVDRYLNLPGSPYRFEPWGAHVYMVASKGRIFSKTLSAAWMEACEISFYVPLIRHQKDKRWDFVFAKPFSFVDDPTLAMSLREVAGVPTLDAGIENVSPFWQSQGPVLRVQVDVFTALDAGLPAKRRTLIEVVRGAPAPSASGPMPSGDGYRDWVVNNDAQALDLHLLTLKQFRDAEKPNCACYQSLILEKWTLAKSKKIERLPGMTVKIYRYPSLPVADKLGLLHDQVLPQEMDGTIAYVLTPDDPFRLELDIHISRAEVLSQTAGSLSWRPPLGKSPGERQVPDQGKKVSFREIVDEYDKLRCLGPEPLLAAFLQDRLGAPTPGASSGPAAGNPGSPGQEGAA